MRGFQKRNLLIFAAAVSTVLAFLSLRAAWLSIDEQESKVWTETPHADCAVVFTGGEGRVREGVDLLARHLVKKLIISGVNRAAAWTDLFPGWIYYGDVRVSDIVLERHSRSTFGNAVQSAALSKSLGCKSVVLVTSRVHMARAFQVLRAELDPAIRLTPHGIFNIEEEGFWARGIEAMKRVFYSLWAY